MSQPTKDEEALIGLTKNALADVLGREPTKQEVWRVHAGFKRMAFMLLDHLLIFTHILSVFTSYAVQLPHEYTSSS